MAAKKEKREREREKTREKRKENPRKPVYIQHMYHHGGAVDGGGIEKEHKSGHRRRGEGFHLHNRVDQAGVLLQIFLSM